MALALTLIVGGAAAGVTADVLKNVQRAKMTATRDLLAIQFRQFASRSQNLQYSMKKTDNQNLYNCVCGVGTCAATLPIDFVLYENAIPNPLSAYYDADGNNCNKNDANCLLELKSKFTAQCLPTLPATDPTPPISCAGEAAEFLAITYSIHQNPFVAAPSVPIKEIKGSVYVQVANLVPESSGICP